MEELINHKLPFLKNVKSSANISISTMPTTFNTGKSQNSPEKRHIISPYSNKISNYTSPVNKPKKKFCLRNKPEKKVEILKSLPIKKLNEWDKDHIKTKNTDPTSIYITLREYYKKNNDTIKLQELESLNSLLKAKKVANSLIVKGSKSNKILEQFFQKDKIEQSSILSNKILKTKTKFNLTLQTVKTKQQLESEFDIDQDTINGMKKVEQSTQFYHNIIKEKMKYENQLRHDLIKISSNIIKKKSIKDELELKLSMIYNEKSELIEEYNNIKNKIKVEIASLEDEYVKRIKKTANDKKDTESKDIVLKFATKASQRSNVLEENLKKLKVKHNQQLEEINKKREECNQSIKINNMEIEYYKEINDQLIREQKQYYLDIIEKGYDSRGEGLIWAVKRILELGVNLEYFHFPKFLTHSQIDYIVEMSRLSLEETQYNIILKALKKKQIKNRVTQNIKKFNNMDDLLLQETKRELEKENQQAEKYQCEMKVKKEIDSKFMHLYEKHEGNFKMFNEKKIEDTKLEVLSYQIKQILKGKEMVNQKEDILEIFLNDEKNKNIFNMILLVRQKIDEINQKKEKLKKEEINNFKESTKKEEGSENIKKSMQNELVKTCLFGSNEQFLL